MIFTILCWILFGIFLTVVIGLIIHELFFREKNVLTKSLNDEETDPTSWMGDNEWILQIKLGTGGNNCTMSDHVYSCKYLYASSTSPTLKLIKSLNVDSSVTGNPAYDFYEATTKNPYVAWNDQGFNSQMNKGVYMQSSNPYWGFFDKGFLNSGKATHPGIQTNLAQHLLFVKLSSSDDIKNMVSLMNHANLCALDYPKISADLGFTPCYGGSCAALNESNMTQKIGGVEILAKPRGKPYNDIWSEINQSYCTTASDMLVYSFCSNPHCPDADKNNKNSRVPAPGVTDVMQMNTDCDDMKFHSFKSNHSKMGVCYNTDVVVIGGNNHSVRTQGPRGGLFVIINNKDLADSMRCLLKTNSDWS